MHRGEIKFRIASFLFFFFLIQVKICTFFLDVFFVVLSDFGSEDFS